MQEKKIHQKMKKKIETEKKLFFVWEYYAQNERELQIYSKNMRI